MPPPATREAADSAVARALWAALRTFSGIAGATVRDEPDATLVLSNTPYANFNNVIAANVAVEAADERIVALTRACGPDSLPVTWWAGPTTGPTDLVGRLQR